MNNYKKVFFFTFIVHFINQILKVYVYLLNLKRPLSVHYKHCYGHHNVMIALHILSDMHRYVYTTD